jgi:hypothetical protein
MCGSQKQNRLVPFTLLTGYSLQGSWIVFCDGTVEVLFVITYEFQSLCFQCLYVVLFFTA